jgi:hypothetical protein
MPTGLKRYQQTNHFHFLTFSCYHRQPFLNSPGAKDTTLQLLEATRKKQGLGGWPIHKTNPYLGYLTHAVSLHEWAFAQKREPQSFLRLNPAAIL